VTVPEPRVELLDADAAREAAERVGIPSGMADLSVFRALLVHEELAGRVSALLHQLLWNGALDARLRELLIMRIGWAQGSEYEWTQHWRVARLLDIDEGDVLAVRDWQSSDRFDRADRAVLAATDETLVDGAISAATWEELEQVVTDPKARVELVVAIANWTMFAQLLRSLAIPLEEGVEPWPPDGQPSPRALVAPTSLVRAAGDGSRQQTSTRSS
jgi:alkylhydroperoxidase family enzyme